MPKGQHLKKADDLKRVKSILLRFTKDEFDQLQNYCQGIGMERSELVREAVFKTISLHKNETQPQPQAYQPLSAFKSVYTEQEVSDFLSKLVDIYTGSAQKNNFNRKMDCNIYRANIHEFMELLKDYTSIALTEEFKRYCTIVFGAEIFNNHLFRGFEMHISDNFVFFDKHNRRSANFIG